MNRHTPTAVFFVILFCLTLFAGSSAIMAGSLDKPPAGALEQRLKEEGIAVDTVWIPMRDGTRLAATLAKPFFGSDFPIESPDPRKGIYAAVARADEQGNPRGGWYPAQRLSVEEALDAFSTEAARVVGDDAPLADFTVFARDLRKVAPLEILEVPVLRVVVGGQEVYVR